MLLLALAGAVIIASHHFPGAHLAALAVVPLAVLLIVWAIVRQVPSSPS